MRLTDRSVWTAPPPNAVRQATAQPVNQHAGLGIYFYWIVAHYPIGKIVSEPFQVSLAPMPITTENPVFLSWEAAPTATSYDLLRTTTPRLPTDGTAFGLALNLPATTTTFLDTVQILFAYDVTELMHGSPVDGWAQMNNKDFQEPVLELWPTVSISKIIFADGSQQNSAGGGVISGVASVFGRTGNVVAQYGDYNASQISLLPPIGPWTNVEMALQGLWQPGTGGTIYYNGGNVGIGTASPVAALTVTGSEITARGHAGPVLIVANEDWAYVTFDTASGGPFPFPGGGIIFYDQGNYLGEIDCWRNGPISGIVREPVLSFYVGDFEVALEKMRLTLDGKLGVNLRGVGDIGNNPQFGVDVNGDINCTGVYRINGVPVPIAFAAAASDVESRLANIEQRLAYLGV